jgi:hypothetical protein
MLKLMDLNYKIQYKKGTTNTAVDALSRCPESSDISIMAISTSTPTWIEKLKAGYDDDSEAKQLLTELSLSKTNDKSLQESSSKAECGLATMSWPRIILFKLYMQVD